MPEKNEKSFWYAFAHAVAVFWNHCVTPVSWRGPEKLTRRKAPYILIANHQSWSDVFILACACPYEIHFLGKQELTRGRIAGYLLPRLHMISVSRHEADIAAMRACSKVLRTGNVLGIFPEGTRKLPSMMSVVEDGVSLLALREKVPVIPVYIHGKPRPFHRVHAFIGTPLAIPEDRQDPNRENALFVNGLIRDTFCRMCETANGKDSKHEQIG